VRPLPTKNMRITAAADENRQLTKEAQGFTTPAPDLHKRSRRRPGPEEQGARAHAMPCLPRLVLLCGGVTAVLLGQVVGQCTTAASTTTTCAPLTSIPVEPSVSTFGAFDDGRSGRDLPVTHCTNSSRVYYTCLMDWKAWLSRGVVLDVAGCGEPLRALMKPESAIPPCVRALSCAVPSACCTRTIKCANGG
jgi:hypothetical protein